MKRVPFFAFVGLEDSDQINLLNALKRILSAKYRYFSERYGTETSNEFSNPAVLALTELIDTGVLNAHGTPRSLLKIYWARLDIIIKEHLLEAFLNGEGACIRGFGAMALIRAMMRSTSETEREELIHLHKQIVEAAVLRAGAWAPHCYFYLRRDLTIPHEGFNLSASELARLRQMDELLKLYNTFPGQRVAAIDMGRPLEEVLAEVLGHIERIEQELEFVP